MATDALPSTIESLQNSGVQLVRRTILALLMSLKEQEITYVRRSFFLSLFLSDSLSVMSIELSIFYR